MKDLTYKMDHITLNVVNEKQMRAFYKELFGFVEVESTSNSVSYAFQAGDAPVLTLIFGQHAKTKPQMGLYHFALLFPNAGELAAIVERLIMVGYPIGGGDHTVSEAIYLNDPDGNGIELYHDRPADGWEWQDGKVIMGTEEVDVPALLNEQRRSWDGFSTGMKIGHLHFTGTDVSQGDAFFDDFLGMDIVSELADSADFYSHNHYHHHHAFNTWQGTNLSKKQLNEGGLLAWDVTVSKKYFEVLKQKLFSGMLNDDVLFIDDNRIQLFDSMGSILTINVKE